MELLALVLLVGGFFTFFKIGKDKKGTLKLERRDTSQLHLPSPHHLLASPYVSGLITVGFMVAEILLVLRLISPLETLIKVRASQLIPDKFTPIARFAANMNWETMTVNLDASMSKAYQDKISNYIWRIDDGTSLVGSKTLEHTFTNPGYYLIQLSVVDEDNQSDVATCQVLIPPQELEKVATHERMEESKVTQEKVQDVEYEWAPKGTFFNYSKMAATERSYANLKSHYIESGCGYSNKSYNTYSNSYVDFLQDSRVQQALVTIFRIALLGLVVFPGVYTVIKYLIRRTTLPNKAN